MKPKRITGKREKELQKKFLQLKMNYRNADKARIVHKDKAAAGDIIETA